MIICVRRRSVPLVVAAISLGFTACDGVQDAAQEPPLRNVKTARVQAIGELTNRIFSGTVSSTKETSLSFRVSGTVIAKNVSVADQVNSGDVLARLDPAPFELEVQRAVASLAEARSNAQNANSSYERTKRLYEAGNSSRETLDNARTSLKTAQAQQASMAKALELAQLDLRYTRLISEDRCGIAATDLQVGENVQQGQQVILANCGDRLEVDLGIPERFITQVQKGADVGVSFPALPAIALRGVVDDVGISATSGGTTFPVTVALPLTAGDAVKAGLSAQVTFGFRTSNRPNEAAVLIVPALAVGEDQTGRYVYILDPAEAGTGVVRRTNIRAGALTDEGVEILSGLKENMLVVTAGVSVLRDGLTVRLSSE